MGSTVDTLAQFGLSETEAAAYLAVLERGTATVAAVSDETDISTGYVYDIAENLADRGLVVVDDHHTPTQIRAVDPESAVESMTAVLTDLEADLSERYTETEPDYPAVEVVRSRQTLYDRLEHLVETADDEVFVMVPTPVAARVAEALTDARDRGVFVALLLGGDDGEAARAADGAAHVARSWDPPVESLVMVDNEAAVTSDSSLLHGEHREGHYGLVLEQSPKVAGAVASQWFNFWAAADEVATGEPPALPAEELPFRFGLFTAVEHGADRDLQVTADLFPGQDRERITAPLVEVKQGLVEPVTYDFPVQNTLVVEADGERVTVGGPGAFVEDYSARSLTISER
ncbi:TrmB family transcriptional regulator [Haloarcula litorea]|uniref:TrmB family transcriptional regulator n=1 Tax=Haloarcula litorea TaxID=3032579 RepID=UPI0023E86A9A|nr:TrmB family transcriptional regulator sugar-binding domain-containing protein [Halomicroarcula sp. GDY20]